MISILLFATGVIVLVASTYDFLYTTISLTGLGPISLRLTRGLWLVARKLTRISEQRAGVSLRSAIGPTILSVLAAFWMALFLMGYVMLYVSGASLQTSSLHEPANLVEIIAFAGSTLSTLGASTVEPTNGWWDILSMVAAINGMVVLTLSVTFVLNILQTTLAARSWAMRYNALMDAADARQSDHTPANITSLGPELCNITVKFTASPLTGYFVPNDSAMSFPKAISHLCNLMEAQDRTQLPRDMKPDDLVELRTGLSVFGRHIRSHRGEGDFASVRAWAYDHSLPA